MAFAGQFPAIDRLLARKQAISKLQRLRDPASATCCVPDCSALAVARTSCPQVSRSDPSTALQPSNVQLPAVTIASHSDVSCTTQQIAGQLHRPHKVDPSEVAHYQYLSFKSRRQQCHDAAVMIQRHTRGFLACLLFRQVRCLDNHRKRMQRQKLTSCMHAWRGFTDSQRHFR